MDEKFERDVNVQVEANKKIEQEKAIQKLKSTVIAIMIMATVYFVFHDGINKYISDLSGEIDYLIEKPVVIIK